MKLKLILLLMALGSFSLIANAQIEQGTIYAGVNSNLNYSSTSVDGAPDNVNQFNLNLMGGYFFVDNVMGGLGIGYNTISAGNTDFSSTNWTLFGRYYINGQIFLGAGYESQKQEDIDAINSLALEAGYAAFITDDITVEPSLGYGLGLGDNDANTFVINVGFGIYLK